ncbi:MAG: exodeoxyribonuclease III [Planctomycetota bacterium]|jgi:exodeoxyribonuclease-3
MKITTWNVNSIRSRLERVLDWMERRRPDVLCLQETKVTDDVFPRDAFEALGYHVEAHGQKTYNGVALISRRPLTDVVRGLGDDPDHQRRLIAATAGDVRVVCVYVPNGEAVDSPKFAYKLEWLGELRRFLDAWTSPEESVLVLGDFNVAPDDRDVHDPEAWRGHVLFHPREHAALAEVCGWGLEDLFRKHEDGAGFYTWWDYRQLAFPKNAGLRIDLVLGTPAAAARCEAVRIERDERKGKKPSDHAPVTAYLDETPE